MAVVTKRILILCKTYPSPSARYVETSCVAGLTDESNLVRLYPVPFRLIADDKQFKKYQWIRAKLEKARNDRRPESFRIFVDQIHVEGPPLPTAKGWAARREWIDGVPTYTSFAELESARKERGVTLGLVRPDSIEALEITPAATPDWTKEEREKLIQQQVQGSLPLVRDEARQLNELKKLPYDFHYRYRCGADKYCHKIVDWEAGALFWKVWRSHGDGWEPPFRRKIETELPKNDLSFLMGTIHRFPDQWLIVSLIYPPRMGKEPERRQGELFEG